VRVRDVQAGISAALSKRLAATEAALLQGSDEWQRLCQRTEVLVAEVDAEIVALGGVGGKGASHALFHLVQVLLQSGPLRFSKPASFRRAAPSVARHALRVLAAVEAMNLFCGPDPGFTSNQRTTLHRWAELARRVGGAVPGPASNG